MEKLNCYIKKTNNYIKKIDEYIRKLCTNKKFLLGMIVIITTIISVYVRVCFRKYVSSDMEGFLIPWLEEIAQKGGIFSLKYNIGDYNVSYQLILIFLYYVQKLTKLPSIYLIKMVSCFFDYVGAIFVGLIISEILKKSKNRIMLSVLGYCVTIMLPSVVIDSSIWGQCDFIYVSFILISLYLLLKNKILFSFVSLGLAFAFKLQFIFILPLYLLLYLKRKDISIIHFFIIPIVNAIVCLPAVIFGRSIKDCFMIYVNQTKTYSEMTLNCPNFYQIFNLNSDEFSKLAVGITLIIMLLFFGIILYRNYKIKEIDYIELGIISVWIFNFFLPHMHERYAFLANILLIIYTFISKKINYFIIFELICTFIYSDFLCYSINDTRMKLYAMIIFTMIVMMIKNFVKNKELENIKESMENE